MPINNGFEILESDSPLSIPGLLVFHDDAKTENFEFNVGNQISKWYDLSGNALHATQSVSANQPSYINNKLEFDGSLTYLNSPLKYDWTNDSFSIYTVQNGNGAPVAGYKGVFTNRPGFSKWITVGHYSGGGFTMEWSSGNVIGFAPAWRDDLENEFIFTMLKETTIQNTIRINNSYQTVLGTGNYGTIAQGLQIGSWGGVPSIWNGTISTFLFYNRKLSAPEDAQVMRYLSNKKGIQL